MKFLESFKDELEKISYFVPDPKPGEMPEYRHFSDTQDKIMSGSFLGGAGIGTAAGAGMGGYEGYKKGFGFLNKRGPIARTAGKVIRSIPAGMLGGLKGLAVGTGTGLLAGAIGTGVKPRGELYSEHDAKARYLKDKYQEVYEKEFGDDPTVEPSERADAIAREYEDRFGRPFWS